MKEEKKYWFAESKTNSGRINCGHKHRFPETARKCLQSQGENGDYRNGYIKCSTD